MIDQATIQRIFDKADILEVVSDFVSLKKRGSGYVGCCPFHNEKTGSFIVSPARGTYKCFGCGAGGNVVKFIMEHEQMSYPEALRYLAARYNIPIEEHELTEKQKLEKTERESMLLVTKFASDFFIDQLKTDEGISVALGYMKHRGIADDSIQKFSLGYCPNAWDSLAKAALEKGYKEEFLIKTGLCVKNERGIFDRFHGRVIFPIQDIAGKIIAFGGRIMTNDKSVGKYVNSPESEIYHKSHTLYGIYFAKRAIVRENRCFLVEGYLDVISFQYKGIENTVASSGTSLTIEQIQLIRRLTPNVTIIYDGDAAGIKASLRGIDLVLAEGLNVRVVSLPEGDDPDSFAQQHTPQEIHEYISTNETDFIKFKTNLLLPKDGGDPIERASVISDIIHSISLIPNDVTRAVYIRETASALDIAENILYNEITNHRLGKEAKLNGIPLSTIPTEKIAPSNTVSSPKEDKSCRTEELVLIRYLLNFGEQMLYNDTEQAITVGEYITNELSEDELELLDNGLNNILIEYRNNFKTADFNAVQYFIRHPDSDINATAASILCEPYELSKIWWQHSVLDKEDDTEEEKNRFSNTVGHLDELLPKVVNNYKMKRIELMSEEVDKKILDLQKSEQIDNEIIQLLRKKSLLNQIRVKLTQHLGRTGIGG